MKVKNDNRRTKYTKMVIKDSLIKLMSDNPISKITVTDICKEADVNRGTFYTYYYDAYDLLDHIQNEFKEQIQASLYSINSVMSSAEMLLEIFTLIYKNRNLCKVLLSENSNKDIVNNIVNIAHDKCMAEWKVSLPDFTERELDFFYSFYSNGAVGIIQKWIHDGFKDSPKMIAKYVATFTRAK